MGLGVAAMIWHHMNESSHVKTLNKGYQVYLCLTDENKVVAVTAGDVWNVDVAAKKLEILKKNAASFNDE